MATGRLPDPNTAPVTAKGDLYTYSTVPAKLAVGSNGETLVADSSASTGLRYNPQNALANPVINGGFDIAQRGTSTSLNNQTAYTLDRWMTFSQPASTITRQSVSDSTNLPNIQYCARVQRNSGNTSTGALYIFQPVETANAIPFAGKTITLSFYARAGANYSPTSSLLQVSFTTGTGTDQNPYIAYTGSVTAINQNATLTTTWQRFAYTATLASNATEMYPLFLMNPTGTAGANDWFEITGVQVDVGTYTASTAPTFRRSGGTLAGELAACMRYYEVIGGGNGYYPIAIGQCISTTAIEAFTQYTVKKRVTPSVTYTAANTFNARTAAAGNTVPTGVAVLTIAQNAVATTFSGCAGLVAGNASLILDNAGANPEIRVSAEL